MPVTQEKINSLKKFYLLTERECQSAFDSNDNDRFVLADKNRRAAWSAHSKAITTQFNDLLAALKNEITEMRRKAATN